MAGINRLGKGPAKPGTMRPQDPNKYKTMDIFSEGTDGDKDYARMVQDIEDTQQNHMGWLFSRGAFDKGDLLYLRDEEEKRRFAEQELRDSELRSFARMRNKVEAAQDPEFASTSEQPPRDSGRLQALQRLIRIKPTAKVKRKPDADGGAAKRVKEEPPQPQTLGVKTEDEDEQGLAGLLGSYGSDSGGEADDSKRATTEPRAVKSEARELPLPDIQIKREVKLEPSEVEGVPAGPHGEEEAEEEAVDYEEDASSDCSSD